MVRHDITRAEHYCEAKTWEQTRSGSWAGSNNGCQRAAKDLTPDGHWACAQHAKTPPACGWN